jgi:hypothetical protein
MKKADDPKEAASRLSRLGAAKGGKARAAAMTSAERSEAARAAVMARWTKEKGTAKSHAPIQATYGAPDRPLRIGEIEIPCYVLVDGRRVLATRGLQAGLGFSRSGGSRPGARRLAGFLASLEAKGINTNDLIARINSPITFTPPHGGKPAEGYEATILPDICDVVARATDAGAILTQQKHVAEQCRILLRGFADIGIIALVDEATGYQDVRARDALATILEAFVAKELRPWVKTFPSEFYKQIYRLHGWHYADDSNARPGIVGHWTNEIVYRRLAPGVLEEIRQLIPRDSKGRLTRKLHQRLTEDIGHPKLRELLTAEIMLMKYSPSWEEFMRRLDLDFPQFGETMVLRFD